MFVICQTASNILILIVLAFSSNFSKSKFFSVFLISKKSGKL